MKNFKTTLAGLVTGLPFLIDSLVTAFSSGSFEGKNTIQLVASVGVILLGWLASDKNNPNNDAQGILGTDRPNDR